MVNSVYPVCIRNWLNHDNQYLMNALTEYIIGNVVASVCIFHKKFVKNKNKMKKNPKTAKSINTENLPGFWMKTLACTCICKICTQGKKAYAV